MTFEDMPTKELVKMYHYLALCPLEQFSCAWVDNFPNVQVYRDFVYYRADYRMTLTRFAEDRYPYLIDQDIPSHLPRRVNPCSYMTRKVRHIFIGEARCRIANVLRRRNVHVA